MTIDELLLILSAFRQPELDGIARESAQSAGSTYLRERMTIIAERCCRDYPGDLVEIGCLNGSTTIRLARVAKVWGRRVIAIDPWSPGTQNCTGAEYDRFLESIEPCKEIVEIVRADSRSIEATQYFKDRALCFAFVDGLHEYQAALSDIRNCYQAPLICVDDITWSTEVKRAWFEGAGERQRIEVPGLHEGYIL